MGGWVYGLHASPIGTLLIAGEGEALARIGFPSGKGRVEPQTSWRRDDAALKPARVALDAYFAGESPAPVTLMLDGTPFQRSVWTELLRIGRGETITYAELARRIGRPRAIRAAGAANGANRLPILVPCHRVIGHDGRLTGFAGGLATKEWLLRHERGEKPRPLV